MGTLLNYVHSMDPTMLHAVNEISQIQSKYTEDTNKKAEMLLDYVSAYPNSVIRYHASDMVLHVN